MRPSYARTQIGWVIIGSITLAGALAIPIALGLRSMTPVFIVGAIEVLILALFGTLRVTVDGEAITARMGLGLFGPRVAVSDVRFVREVRNAWYWGFGIRVYPGGVLYNVSGLGAVELLLKNGKRLRIGTDDPRGLCRAIEAVVGEQPPLTDEELRVDRRRTRRFVLVAVALAASFVCALGGAFYLEAREPKVTVDTTSIHVGSFMYDDSVAFTDVTEVTLERELPKILARTNGFAMGTTLRGHFKVAGLGDGQLFLRTDRAPFIMIKKRQGFVIVAFSDPAETERLFAEIQLRLPAPG